jgi:uncharacterized protein YkwD
MKIARLTGLLALALLPIASQANSLAREFQQEIIDGHNHYRSLHDSPNLQWDDALAEYALRHANLCEFKHSRGPYGENLAAGYPTATDAMMAWYDEVEYYSYSNPGFSMNTGHFTQMVWKSTLKIGCAKVRCNGRHGTPGDYLVCEYSPAGNIVSPGYFADNVTRPRS